MAPGGRELLMREAGNGAHVFVRVFLGPGGWGSGGVGGPGGWGSRRMGVWGVQTLRADVNPQAERILSETRSRLERQSARSH
ncbi:hypothetical protein EYF80_060127 [Liparis tanakae]|uniref:Uncharacterized protein n=1 Tax=Liparis tanakae TaxID=230148 RepID=A0A4Z2ELS9_9TELE|nr:hypothetical protein EYF80_060127 [Liparis tanakae]